MTPVSGIEAEMSCSEVRWMELCTSTSPVRDPGTKFAGQVNTDAAGFETPKTTNI